MVFTAPFSVCDHLCRRKQTLRLHQAAVMRVHHRGRPAAGMVSMPASLHPRRMRKKPSSPHSGPQLLATSQYGPPLSSSPQPISLTAWPPMGSLACADRRYTPLW